MALTEEDKLRRENGELRERISFLEEQVLQLKEMLIPTTWQAPRILRLTTFESLILEALYHAGNIVSTKRLKDVLYYFRSDGDVPIGNGLQVFMSRLRRKVKPYGITIDTIHGRGYLLTPESFVILKAMGYHKTNLEENPKELEYV